MDENEITEEPKERTINELMDLPYSEMTEEEIGRVVEFKAAVKARDEEFQRRMDAMTEKMNAVSEMHMKSARAADALLAELTAHAINQYKAVSDGQA